MRSPFTHMYLRPGQLWKTFEVLRSKSENQTGYLVESHERTGEMVTGVISVADSQSSERTKHLWDQDKHSLTHTMVVRGRPDLRKNDLLASTFDEKAYLVLAVDNVGQLAGSGLIYLEERNDLK